MMKSEFIDRTGFEPTAKEYEEIENQYMESELDKDQFCKEWKKNGGIQRLTRYRAIRIEQLEYDLEKEKERNSKLETQLKQSIEGIVECKSVEITRLKKQLDEAVTSKNALAYKLNRILGILND